jgi:hypothetical protein
VHYALIGEPKPDGTLYTNTDKDWLWLSGNAVKAARWLGYLPFNQIIDQRNAAPVVRRFTQPDPWHYLTTALDIDVPDVDDLMPQVEVNDFNGTQPYKVVMFGEKSSLDTVLSPIAQSYAADLYLPTGEISDTQLHTMAQVGAEDGRPMVVLTFSDCDPAGWQMPISIGRKLQALQTLLFPDLDFQVYRVALTPDHVREHGLPSTPLKETERRADNWRDAMGVQQTEIDALATLDPGRLTSIAEAAVAPFHDPTLDRRVMSAQSAWLNAAQAAVDAQLDSEHSEAIRAAAEERLAGLRTEIDTLRDALRIDSTAFDLPEIVIPTAELDPEVYGQPLLDSQWSFIKQCRALKASKAYEGSDE